MYTFLESKILWLVLQCSLSQLELSSPFAGKEWDFMGITYQGWEGKRVWAHVLLENCKKNEIAKMCISLIWERIYAVKKCAKWVHRELGVNYIWKDNFIGT